MMNDGGRAFPVPYSTDGRAEDGPQSGMTLRQWYAGQALSGALTVAAIMEAIEVSELNTASMEELHETMARTAFSIADAMLAQEDD